MSARNSHSANTLDALNLELGIKSRCCLPSHREAALPQKLSESDVTTTADQLLTDLQVHGRLSP